MDHSQIIDPTYQAKVYWMFAGGFIGLAALVHVKDLVEYRIRMQNVYLSRPDPARPQSALLCAVATATAVVREATYYARRVPWLSHLPPTGHLLLLAVNFTLLLTMVFYDLDPRSPSNWEMIAVRAGWMSLAQLPLVFLMAGKANLVAAVTGSSYERLNWLHRAVARCMFITVLIHLSFFLRSWARYDYIATKFSTDENPRDGLGAFCVLLWLLLSSVAPVRGWRYEVFVAQHLVSAAGFLYAVWNHVPVPGRIYMWVPAGLWVFDRVVRAAWLAYNNLAIFHAARPNHRRSSSLFTCRAVFTPLPDAATRVTIANPPFSWTPGQHAFLSCPTLAPLQSHPFTITSLPSDGVLEFVIRAHSGGTRQIHTHATSLLPPHSSESKPVLIDGPYGRLRPLEQFDTVVLFAGSTGASFVLPLLRDLVRHRSAGAAVVTRRVRLVWVVKRRGQVAWFAAALQNALTHSAGISVDASIYVTCDPELTAEIPPAQSRRSSLAFDEKKPTVSESRGGCATSGCNCTRVIADEDAIVPSARACCCAGAGPSSPPASSAGSDSDADSVSSLHKSLDLPRAVTFITGRPAVRVLLEKELVRARGESAVVVCGPAGLVQATREAVCELADERAVHKGSGAQGVWLHTEGFSW
ncbi:FAD-binding domain-containing protein [Geopyxis carbonaria]|nr:FAD-binding domain-containing protein [Geopyxis carbonaria]